MIEMNWRNRYIILLLVLIFAGLISRSQAQSRYDSAFIEVAKRYPENLVIFTGRNNAYSVYFRNDSGRINGYKLSIFGRPIITPSWNFKFGNYATE
jgi:hypothetical protein